ncbi:MAG: SLC13 family permease [Gemmatimonadales bacterium]
MSGAAWSLVALLVAIIASVVTRLNVGVLAIALAWLVGVGAAGLSAGQVIQGFPSSLFLTLVGVTLLFAAAEANGTLARLTHRALAITRGNARGLPVLFFVMTGLLSSLGPGSISSVALVAPIGMAVAGRAGIPPFLMALAVANGANAGNLSPISSVGVIANSKMAEVGLGGHELKVWFANFAAHLLVTVIAYFALGGHRLSTVSTAVEADDDHRLGQTHWLTLAVILGWIVGVLAFKLNLGLSAFLAAAVLFGLRGAAEGETFRRMPWAVIVMVSGVSVLIGVLEHSGGMELFTGLLARLTSGRTVNGMIAFVTGAISSYSSTSGVVLPAFLPTAASLVEKVGGGDPLAVALSINVGSSIVDVSPLSTLGALCVAAISDEAKSERLFRQLLVWGLSMTLVGALLSQLFAGMVARW